MTTDNHNVNDEKLVSQVSDVLDDSVERIDAETMQRIVAARKQALASTESLWARLFTVPKLLTAAATAASLFVAVLLVNTQLKQSSEMDSIEIAGTQDTIELYEEIEFYTWLAEEDVAG